MATTTTSLETKPVILWSTVTGFMKLEAVHFVAGLTTSIQMSLAVGGVFADRVRYSEFLAR